MKLKINKEFLLRHLFSLAVFVVLGGWFGFDAFIRYPRTNERDLYVSIEKSEPHDKVDLKSFKAQKIETQRLFTLFALLAATGVGLHLLVVSLFKFEFDDEGFVVASKRYSYSDIKSVDVSNWEKKGILVISGDGFKVKLDAWHHFGVKEFYAKCPKKS